MSPRAQQFIQLQRQINEQINRYGIADAQLVGELDVLSDQLTNDEINEVVAAYEPEDDGTDEWIDEMAAYTTQMDDYLMGE